MVHDAGLGIASMREHREPLLLPACSGDSSPDPRPAAAHLDSSDCDDVLGGSVRLLPVNTPKGDSDLLGQSWGGILAIGYAPHYPQHLMGLLLSNMMASVPAYNEYANAVLMPAMDQRALAEIERLEAAAQYDDPHYLELLIPHDDVLHILRMPYDPWPDPVNRAFKHLNPKLYVAGIVRFIHDADAGRSGAGGTLAAYPRKPRTA